MKKYLIIIPICLVICGCGAKKSVNKETEKTNKTLSGTYEMEVTCGEKTTKSYVTFDGTNAEYGFYSCSNNDIHLITAEGTYEVDNDMVIITDSYDQKWELAMKKDNELMTSVNNEDIILTK